MRSYSLTCGKQTIQHLAHSTAEAFDHGFQTFGHLGRAITCLCLR